jgi:hypothetical protein
MYTFIAWWLVEDDLNDGALHWGEVGEFIVDPD